MGPFWVNVLWCAQTRRSVHGGGGGAHHSGQTDPAPVPLHRPVQTAAAPAQREEETIPAPPQSGARDSW